MTEQPTHIDDTTAHAIAHHLNRYLPNNATGEVQAHQTHDAWRIDYIDDPKLSTQGQAWYRIATLHTDHLEILKRTNKIDKYQSPVWYQADYADPTLEDQLARATTTAYSESIWRQTT